jgi:hypothetical protein
VNTYPKALKALHGHFWGNMKVKRYHHKRALIAQEILGMGFNSQTQISEVIEAVCDASLWADWATDNLQNKPLDPADVDLLLQCAESLVDRLKDMKRLLRVMRT